MITSRQVAPGVPVGLVDDVVEAPLVAVGAVDGDDGLSAVAASACGPPFVLLPDGALLHAATISPPMTNPTTIVLMPLPPLPD
jgi:hypothetical protein